MSLFFRRFWILAVIVLWIAGSLPSDADAQYFGRNKVQYEDFEFRTLETEHFVFHFYPEEERAVRDAARMAERWYNRHTQVFNHRFEEKKPIIFYANDADFRQTNVTDQPVGPGTGGFTESRRERVVMPLSPSYAETSHVLGHELVHSFQFDLALSGDGPTLNLNQIPLWMTEGMAEYFSIGRSDSHTAMWMRDAVLHNNMPSFDDLQNYGEYFPYRYGQAILAYIGGKYGDQSVSNLYRLTGQVGADSAYVRLFGISADSLTTEWAEATQDAYAPLITGRTSPDSAGTRVLAENIDAGRTNIAPTLSPDGRYVAFISSRELFRFNLFVADARTGEVVAELESSGTTRHFNALRFLNSAGTWSPDGTKLAFISYSDGDNQITIWDVESESIQESIRVKGVTSMKNPAWSPDGSKIAFTGTNGGISDLYVLDLSDATVEQLTNDRYADLQPTWSPDGSTLAFTTDRGRTDLSVLDVSKNMTLAEIDVATNEITTLAPFDDALHHNPQYSPDGRSLYFVSDPDGFKDIYRVGLASGDLHRVTRLKTGVSGVTAMSPAMSVAAQSGDLMMSVYNDGRYTGFRLGPDAAEGDPLSSNEIAAGPGAQPVPPAPSADARLDAPATPPFDTSLAVRDTATRDTATRDTATRDTMDRDSLAASPVDTPPADRGAPVAAADSSRPLVAADTTQDAGMLVTAEGKTQPKAGVLPPYPDEQGLVATYLNDPEDGVPPPSTDYDTEDYDAGLSVEAIVPPRAGVSVGGPFGTSASGGVAVLFGDMLGNQQLVTYLQARGTIRDIGGGVSYLNRKNQLNWGGSLSHTPVVTSVDGLQFNRQAGVQVVRRIQLTQGSIDFQYPLSPTRRFEFSVGGTRYGFGVNVRELGAIDEDISLDELNSLLEEEFGTRPFLPERDTRYYGQTSLAYVRDFSQAGLTSPIQGGRWRLQVTPRVGPDSYVQALADLRRYVYAKPFTFAFQGLHIGNYGAEPSFRDRFGFGDEYLGYPYGQGFVRGYNLRDIDTQAECPSSPQDLNQPGAVTACPEIDRLLGTRIATVRAEVRLPLFGPERLSVIPFRFLPTELALFADAGIAWTQDNPPVLDFDTNSEATNIPVTSAGVAARFNVLGRVILEGYYAIPFQRPERSGEWGLRISPGW